MSNLVGVLAAAVEIEAFCRRMDWPFCFIGGIAIQRWGMPRFTQDVDLTLFTGFGREATFVDAFLAQFPGRLRDTRQFAIQQGRRRFPAQARTSHPYDLPPDRLMNSPWRCSGPKSVPVLVAPFLRKVMRLMVKFWS